MATSTLPVAFLLPGQGAQYPGMATGLYRSEPAFADAVDAVFAALGPRGRDVRADWLSEHPRVPVDEVTRSTPLLFAVEYGLGVLLSSWGVQPAALLGHSVGELVAAVLAGVLDLAETAWMVGERAARMAAAPPGGMVAVLADAARVRRYLRGQVAVAAVNGPAHTVVAGPDGALAEVVGRLRADGLLCRRIPARTAFHSPVLAHLSASDAPLVAALDRRPPRLPVYSAYLGGPLTGAAATSVSFWAGQPAAPVLFWPALRALLDRGDHVLVEVGPGDGLRGYARRAPAVATGRCPLVGVLPGPPGGAEAERATLEAAREALATSNGTVLANKHAGSI